MQQRDVLHLSHRDVFFHVQLFQERLDHREIGDACRDDKRTGPLVGGDAERRRGRGVAITPTTTTLLVDYLFEQHLDGFAKPSYLGVLDGKDSHLCACTGSAGVKTLYQGHCICDFGFGSADEKGVGIWFRDNDGTLDDGLVFLLLWWWPPPPWLWLIPSFAFDFLCQGLVDRLGQRDSLGLDQGYDLDDDIRGRLCVELLDYLLGEGDYLRRTLDNHRVGLLLGGYADLAFTWLADHVTPPVAYLFFFGLENLFQHLGDFFGPCVLEPENPHLERHFGNGLHLFDEFVDCFELLGGGRDDQLIGLGFGLESGLRFGLRTSLRGKESRKRPGRFPGIGFGQGIRPDLYLGLVGRLDIEAREHPLDLCEIIDAGADDEAVCSLIGDDGNRDGRRFGGAASSLLRRENPLQRRCDLLCLGVLESEDADGADLDGVGVYLGDYPLNFLHNVGRCRDYQAIGGDVRHYLCQRHFLCHCFFGLGMRYGNYLCSDRCYNCFGQVGGLGVFQFDDANDACLCICWFDDVHAGD